MVLRNQRVALTGFIRKRIIEKSLDRHAVGALPLKLLLPRQLELARQIVEHVGDLGRGNVVTRRREHPDVAWVGRLVNGKYMLVGR